MLSFDVCKRLIMGMGSRDCGGREGPPSAVRRLETQAGWGVQRPENGEQTARACGLSPEPGARTSGRKMGVQPQRREAALPALCCLGPEHRDAARPHCGGPSALRCSPGQMLISSGHTSQTPSNNVASAIWASHSPVKLTQEMHHHNRCPSVREGVS